MLTTAVAPVTIVGSPMLSGSRAGRAPKTPASYTSSRSGATVRLARLTAMLGSPTPTKQTRWPASSRAAATIIISDFVKAAVSALIADSRAGGRHGPPNGPTVERFRREGLSRSLQPIDGPGPAPTMGCRAPDGRPA